MIKGNPQRFRTGRAWRYWPVAVSGIALTLVAGAHPVDGDDLEKDRSVIEPTGGGGASNMTVIEKDQVIDADTFDQTDSPAWPLVERLRSTPPQNGR
ncbi:hypothetical protein [Sphaerimonospora thailandensis]|uniref:Uncharacterized protein n=1 Tax=Sphaerimonospora thailandensis TaxID=795644 RepID=A0A8J3RDW5_9ACTN|nr:hypothetical protein [Sphaerimonospora thailandensis]GIH73019.1 hypothetical protein Mth01_52720 [Sphaerimonospora thailandensis]